MLVTGGGVTQEHWLWIAVFSYTAHMLEEHELNWRGWAHCVLRLPVEWSTFYVVNGIVVVVGICCAMVGWREPWFALSFPALMLINATFFHVLPTILTRVYSPGLATAVLLFYPVAGWCYRAAWRDGVLSWFSGATSVLLAAALMAYPIVLLRIKGKSWFTYEAASSSKPGGDRTA